MVRNLQATSATGLRKNRVTQKTRLRVVQGELDYDALLLDDEEERNKVLASQGVDAEDANEHHLQAVLNSHRKHDLPGKQTIAAHIPIPDAAGLVEGYEILYPAGKFKQPTTHIRFSDTVEEIIENGLAGGFAYFLDERDAEWLEKNNQEARGEGTSASATSGANGTTEESPMASTRSVRRGSRGKGKEPEQAHVPTYTRVTVNEDELELVMGLFEKLTEEKFPFLHLSPDSFPIFADYESVFAGPLPPATFASYMVPGSVPPPERLVLVAHTVYPHWKARKVEREGQRVVPQLDYDDSRESSYICFRRREAKPVRRTRASSTAYTDKLARLRTELYMGLDLAKMVLEREQMKTQAAAAAQEVWRLRCQLVENWRSGENKVPGLGVDESLLFDRERMPKKPKVEGLGRIILGLNRRAPGPQSASATPSTDQHSPLTAHLDLSTVHSLSAQGYVAIQSTVRDRYRDVQADVEREMASLRGRDNGWEDVLDLPYQPTPLPSTEKYFRSCPPPSIIPRPSVSSSSLGINFTVTVLDSGKLTRSHFQPHPVTCEVPRTPHPNTSDTTPPNEPVLLHDTAPSAPERVARALRLRMGRGGRFHLDRRLYPDRTHPLLNAEGARWPPAWASVRQRRDDLGRVEDLRWKGRDWRPGPMSSLESNRPRSARKPGAEYWAHESVHADENVGLGKRKRAEFERESVFGFEHCGLGLEFMPFAEWEKGPAVEVRERTVELGTGKRTSTPDEESDSMDWRVDEGHEDELERVWRVEDQWRYDADYEREEKTQYLLDDFQTKFLRPMVKVLDAVDHDIIMMDAKSLSPPQVPDATSKPIQLSNRSVKQERVRRESPSAQKAPSLQLQPPPMLSSHSPFHTSPAPSTTPPLPLPQIASGRMDEQIRRMARQTPSVSPTTAVMPQTGLRMSVPQAPPVTPTPLQPNGVPLKPTSFPNGIAVDSGATVRVSTPARPKSHTPSPQQALSQQAMGVNGFPQHQPPNHLALHPGHAHGLNQQQYATLRNVFAERVPGVPQHHQQQHQQPGRAPMQTTHANVNHQMGSANLNLKVSSTRHGQLRMNGTATGGDTNIGGQGVVVHVTPPRPNNGSPIPPHPRTPSVNGHLMTQNNASPTNAHLLGRVSPLARATLSGSPHHHSHLTPMHPSPPQGRQTAPLPHQPVVGGAVQGHGYS